LGRCNAETSGYADEAIHFPTYGMRVSQVKTDGLSTVEKLEKSK
jgi:hypothetical protein